MTIAVAMWALTHVAGISTTFMVGKVLFNKFQYLGIVSAPVLWLLFAITYTGRRRWLDVPRVLVMFIVPVLTLVLTFTNELHGLIWQELHLTTDAGLVGLDEVHGEWFLYHALYSYAAVFFATALFVWTLSQSPHARLQLVAASAAPVVVGLANLTFLSPGQVSQWLDFTPLAFALACVIFAWGLFRTGLLDLLPVARSEIIENIADAILVIDREGRISDINPAGRALLGGAGSQTLGRKLTDVLRVDGIEELLRDGVGGARDVELPGLGVRQTFDVNVSMIRHPAGGFAGRVLVFHDTTERRIAEQKLQHASASLLMANEELERLANTDSLTALANRRSFMMSLAAEVRRWERHGSPVSLLILDLDRFKPVNDEHGHQFGDRVLVSAANALRVVKRDVDIAGRLGGEEFGILLPDTPVEGAVVLAERMRERIADRLHETPDGSFIRVTTSIGIASLGVHCFGESDLLRLADSALYRAKREGRDRVRVAAALGPGE
jgi:diguanylate cyclase (GGDEF)-like protein/PAS domain S-box-containing protein